jgi:hypothetical protein
MVSGAEQDFVPNPTLVTLVLAYVSTPKKNRLETTEASTLLLYGACFFSEDLLYRRFKKTFLSEERVGTGGDRKVRAVVTAPCDVSPSHSRFSRPPHSQIRPNSVPSRPAIVHLFTFSWNSYSYSHLRVIS